MKIDTNLYRKRKFQLKIDLFEDEKKQIRALAEASGLTQSEYVRTLIRARYAIAVRRGRIEADGPTQEGVREERR